MKWITLLAASFWMVLAPIAGAAQTAEQPVAATDPHDEVVAIFLAKFDQYARRDTEPLNFARQVVASHEELQRIEAQRPGLTAAIAKAAEPVFERQSQRIRAQYGPRLLAIAKQALSPSEAAAVAEYYHSDIVRAISARLTAIEEGTAQGSDPAAAGLPPPPILSLLPRASVAASYTLTPAEERELSEAFRRRPELAKLQRFNALILPVWLDMDGERLTQADFDALTLAIGQGYTAYQAESR